jgi:P27 family predicted phage terminase small subunit
MEPPESVSEAAAVVWREVVATKPAEWFQADTAPVLEAYCNTIVEYRRVAEALAATGPSDLSTYRPLVDMAEKLGRAITSMATKMRLTPQSRYTPISAGTAAKKAGAASRPWSA